MMKPLCKEAKFSDLPDAVRQEVERWQELLETIAKRRPAQAVLKRIAVNQKTSLATVYRKLRAFEDFGWRGLVNRAKLPSLGPPAPPNKFREFLYALWLANRKNYRATHEQMVAMWRGGARIPGYIKSPDISPHNPHPAGWTYANFVYHINAFAGSETKHSNAAVQ
jgi:hypothetical protein